VKNRTPTSRNDSRTRTSERRNDSRSRNPKEEMLGKLDCHHEMTMARMSSQLEKIDACPGKAEATDLEANPEETESEEEHEEVPKEKTIVEILEH
jgi:hypothetical protein